jgi:hypothetical protein
MAIASPRRALPVSSVEPSAMPAAKLVFDAFHGVDLGRDGGEPERRRDAEAALGRLVQHLLAHGGGVLAGLGFQQAVERGAFCPVVATARKLAK